MTLRLEPKSSLAFSKPVAVLTVIITSYEESDQETKFDMPMTSPRLTACITITLLDLERLNPKPSLLLN